MGELLQEWKFAFVAPIFKKGKRSDPLNYCPVSLTCLKYKQLEHILVSEIMKHLEGNNILGNNQFSFQNKHSCESQLLVRFCLCSQQQITSKHWYSGVLKSFDKVSHTRLIQKLE